jgi:hypothetical protein
VLLVPVLLPEVSVVPVAEVPVEPELDVPVAPVPDMPAVPDWPELLTLPLSQPFLVSAPPVVLVAVLDEVWPPDDEPHVEPSLPPFEPPVELQPARLIAIRAPIITPW